MVNKGARMVEVCPACDSPKFFERKTKTPQFKCVICGEAFADPTVRKSKRTTGLAPEPVTPDPDDWQALIDALRRTRAAGSTRAQSKLIAKYSDELSSRKAGRLLSLFGEGVVVERFHEASQGITWQITVGDDPPAATEVHK